ncbi:MAG: D-alanyl-D-alanine carboxypeptidase, partial [Flavimaricola sp.]|nr:D-alanyl-D-alanine carboxypeptidase [Flavimaricola sp.]
GLPEVRVPLVAETDVPRGGFSTRLRTAAMVLLERFGPDAADGA